MLQNEFIRLRALEPQDLDWLFRQENDCNCWAQGNTLAPYSRFSLKRYIAAQGDIYESKALKLVAESMTGQPVGLLDLFHIEHFHRRMEMGILVDPAFRRHGYGRAMLHLLREYAFDYLHFHQIYCQVGVNNTPSQALMEGVGFVRIAVLPDWLRTTDGYEDVLLYQWRNDSRHGTPCAW